MNRINPIALALLAAAMCQVAVAQPPTSPLGPSSASPDGILRPWKEADAATAETGLVYKLLVKVGDTVKAVNQSPNWILKPSIFNWKRPATSCRRRSLDDRGQRSGFLQTQTGDAHPRCAQKNQANELEEERARVDLRMAEGRHQAELDEKRVLELQVRKLEEQLEERTVKAPIDESSSSCTRPSASSWRLTRHKSLASSMSHTKAMFF